MVEAVEQIGPEVRVKEPKLQRSRRPVKLSDPVVAALRAHRADQAARRMKYQGRLVSDGESSWPMSVDPDLVFPTLLYQDAAHPMGRIWTPYAFSKAWRTAITTANERRLAEHVAAGGEPETFKPWEFGIHILLAHLRDALPAGRPARRGCLARARAQLVASVTRAFYSHVIEGEQAETAKVTGAVITGAVTTPSADA